MSTPCVHHCRHVVDVPDRLIVSRLRRTNEWSGGIDRATAGMRVEGLVEALPTFDSRATRRERVERQLCCWRLLKMGC